VAKQSKGLKGKGQGCQIAMLSSCDFSKSFLLSMMAKLLTISDGKNTPY
jgi:hypothetical protein